MSAYVLLSDRSFVCACDGQIEEWNNRELKFLNLPKRWVEIRSFYKDK
jgi:hypothetical protein